MVELSGEVSSGLLHFRANDWHREISINDLGAECRGLVELIDNNPLVCADRVSIPGPTETLILIALGPLAKAQLIVESPIVLTNAPESDLAIDAYLDDLGWSEGVSVNYEPLDFGSVLVANALVKINTPPSFDILDGLFDECYARSFFVQLDGESDWDTKLVAGKPHAIYRLVVSPGEEYSLLRVQVMADRDGKAGAAQAIHAFNVMCGFEESLPFS